MPRPRVISPAKMRRPRVPNGAVMTLQARLHQRIDRMRAFVRTRIVDEWAQNSRAHGPQANPLFHGPRAERIDATRSSWVEERLREMQRELEDDDVTPTIDLVARRVERRNREDFARLVPVSFRRDPELHHLLDGFRESSLARVRSLDADAIDELRDILEEAEREGWRVESLAAELEDRLGVSESRADTIARTQTLQFNAQITRARQTASGIKSFIWRTSGDERVRESHDEIDGEQFDWDDLPSVDGEHVAPGEAINCRCTAEPVLPDLEDAEDESAVGAEDLPLAAE